MPTLKDLYSIQLRELELTLAESDLLLQKDGGLDGELKTSGSLCEQFIRSTLAKYIVPGQFRVTSGYVATPQLLAAGSNLPQCDVLIVDNHLPALLRLANSSIEVLPQEAVIGIIEAKRTLTKDTLKKALKHLSTVVASMGKTHDLKTDESLSRSNKYVLFHNHSSDKPLLGVVAMKSEISDFVNEVSAMIDREESLVDFVWTMDGHALVPGFRTADGRLDLYTHTARPQTKTWTALTHADFANAASEFYQQFPGDPVWEPMTIDTPFSKEAVFARMIGLLSLTLSRIFPGRIQEQQVTDYYLGTR